MSAITPESFLKFIQNAYQTFDRLNLSLEMLAVIAVVVALAFVFAMREVFAWFFKIDDLKNDIRSLEVGIARLENEIKSLHQQRNRAKEDAQAALHALPLKETAQASRRNEQFPFSH